jgi:MFS family permease
MIQSAAAATEVRLLLIGRGLRAFVDGYVAVLLPAYLLALGYGTWQVGLLSTATLLGSALATLTLGAWGHRASLRLLLRAALSQMDVPTRSAYDLALWRAFRKHPDA